MSEDGLRKFFRQLEALGLLRKNVPFGTSLHPSSSPAPGPIHPGEILVEEFLKPLALSQNRLGIDLGIPPQRIGDIVRGRRGITADTALRLARYFGTTAQFWLNLQTRYELDVARHHHLPERIAIEVRPRSPV